MTAATVHKSAPPAANDTPEDLRFAPDFVPAPLAEQLAMAREEFHRFRITYQAATQRERGHRSMHINTYLRELHIRRSWLFNLTQQIKQQERNA